MKSPIELLEPISQINALMKNKVKNYFIITIVRNAESFCSQNEIIISFSEDCKAAIHVDRNLIEVRRKDFMVQNF